jgi:3-oxoacyl-[acyl-carrier protein] reductase
MDTPLLDNVLAHKDSVDDNHYQSMLRFKESGKDSFKEAVELILFLASEESNGITGKLISAKWDNWKEFPKHIRELEGSQVYTLRRIVGRGIGMDWGDK